MPTDPLADVLGPFSRPEVHRRAAEIIRRHSTHPRDIHRFALDGLPLAGVRRALELGCGFGRFSQALARHLPPQAEFIALDSQAANEAPWRENLRQVGRDGRFLCRHIQDRLDFPAQAFDLVAASYSLYFFPAVVPETARVLAPQGVLLAITHSRRSLRELFELLDLDPADSPQERLLARFCAENGRRLLEPWFAEIEVRAYPNQLRFDRESLPALLEYARFKLPLLAAVHADERRIAHLARRAQETLSQRQEIAIAKDDVVFWCRGPRPAPTPLDSVTPPEPPCH